LIFHFGFLPTGLDQAGNLTFRSQLPQANPAKFELPVITPRLPALHTAVVSLRLKLGRALLFDHQR
jgi:hypothetical protein